MNIRLLLRSEIPVLWQIDRREYIANIYRLTDGKLVLEPHNFDVPDWPPGEREHQTPLLEACFDHGGRGWAAFDGETIAGAAVLEGKLFGSRRDTLQLEWLHVSRDYRKQGLGRTLFEMAAAHAKELGAAKMYISATPSENTVHFYMNRGCSLAPEPDPELLALEPEDIHLLYPIPGR
jgi:GNAT superfamily N-acetyltransferase